MKRAISLPDLPLHAWEPTKTTLHLYAQIVGKIRMTLMPPANHWWHVPLYVDTRGLTTGSIPLDERRLTIQFDFVDHMLRIITSVGLEKQLRLLNGLSVASFYAQLFELLDELSIDVTIRAKPYDHKSTIPFAEDEEHHHYDKEYVARYWHILSFTDYVFKKFNSRFSGKTCPVQLYWHSFDLAMTRFSGARGPEMPKANRVNREAYSHEVISFGFWAGDENVPNPAYYSYTYPAPFGLEQESLQPGSARWIEQNGSPMALLLYHAVRTSGNPEQSLLSFLETAYQAGARRAGWDRRMLRHSVAQ